MPLIPGPPDQPEAGGMEFKPIHRPNQPQSRGNISKSETQPNRQNPHWHGKILPFYRANGLALAQKLEHPQHSGQNRRNLLILDKRWGKLRGLLEPQKSQSTPFIQARVFAVMNKNYNDQISLRDVGISGNSQITILDGNAFFVGLKFMTTSYNNEVKRLKKGI